MMIISVTNQKGGVGKTTTSINLGACLADRGKRVLVIDMDPQANASLGLGIDVSSLEETMYDVVMSRVPILSVIQRTSMEHLFVAPGHLNLGTCDVTLGRGLGRTFILRNALTSIQDEYDYILIDSPPALNMLTLNSLVAATHLIIPMQARYYALVGISKLNVIVANIKRKLEHNLELLGVLVTMYDRRSNLQRAVFEEIQDHFNGKVFNTAIRTNVKLSEAEMCGEPIVRYYSKCHGAEDYMSLAEEIIDAEAKRITQTSEREHQEGPFDL